VSAETPTNFMQASRGRLRLNQSDKNLMPNDNSRLPFPRAAIYRFFYMPGTL